MKKNIPNTLTCLNLVCGCVATSFALKHDYGMAMTFIVCGAVFDFFDGFAARLLHVSSPLGKELDSLADDITFGFAPAAIVFALIDDSLLHLSAATQTYNPDSCKPLWQMALPYVAFLIAAFSGLRLAKFNIDTRQTTSFIGLPTPANALFWSALAVGCADSIAAMPYAPAVLVAGVMLSSWLLVAEIPMFALKFKSFAVADNKLRYAFIAISAVLLAILGWAGFSVVIVLYVLISLADNKISHRR